MSHQASTVWAGGRQSILGSNGDVLTSYITAIEHSRSKGWLW